jgi:hypothetical protein
VIRAAQPENQASAINQHRRTSQASCTTEK